MKDMTIDVLITLALFFVGMLLAILIVKDLVSR